MTDWKIGDLALCVDDGPVKIFGKFLEVDPIYVSNLKIGSFYTITDIAPSRDGKFIAIGDWGKRAGGISTRFIKVTPPEADEFDREVIDLLIGEPVA